MNLASNSDPIEALTYKIGHICAQKLIEKELIVDPDAVQIISRVVPEDLVRSVECFMMTISVAERKLKSYKYPVDWWQAFKQRWFPNWLQKRYPPRFVELTIMDVIPLQPGWGGRHSIYFKLAEPDMFIDTGEGL